MIVRAVRLIALVVGAAAACYWLADRYGVRDAAIVWACGTATACGIGAVLLRLSPVGRVGWQNRVAAYLVPWGWRLGRGVLWPIPAASWAVWLAIGAATLVLRPAAEELDATATAVRILLFVAWVADGAGILFVLGTLRQHYPSGSSGGRALWKVAGVLVVLIVGSVGLYLGGLPVLALVVAGGPPALVAGGYGLFLAVVLVAGRNARWN